MYKLNFASKCGTLSKASKQCEDPENSSKEADKIIANVHANDIIDVTQYNIDRNFPKDSCFAKYTMGHCIIGQ